MTGVQTCALPIYNTDFTHQTDGGLIPPTPLAGYFADSADNLLTGNDGAPYQSPNAQYDFGGAQSRGIWDSDYHKKVPRSPGIGSLIYSPRDTVKESGDMVDKEAPNAEIPSTKSRRYWLWIVLRLGGYQISCHDTLDVWSDLIFDLLGGRN